MEEESKETLEEEDLKAIEITQEDQKPEYRIADVICKTMTT
jgi:hypothetical protein